ncbi:MULTISPECIES: lysophospholipid acyltransferase family protein [Rahnella]|jgi:1-acyl-sn-glycerol-3-phosphate acyltransferase|uniref:1-acyl-sn-glycerol-3-phosphate acyltransferase n=1 Tax=Rahnella contaminans TaxID=2703882 RepID=A0A6M2B5A0_9GAMM|nr:MULTISPECIES: lysophospholipid acyltransferase family protein [Rahnella]KAB8308457.1 1-acyl-sn-glycerol-3-phosphate acyltransferase [Rouxiella chamberiensis]MBU9820936.1 1-acyl-sn-glycerol-3-phosphate acyltransferase [Rahnella sp. BCC 1045]MDF1893324.1 lysophospholipid acyltransferase family protein [Rahnella contaminans]NGX88185.1 1-acyl-sn-glycerol-3-phosphate acyltransferase [Rahnella contaminans]
MEPRTKLPLDGRLVAGFLVRLCRLLTGVRARWLAPLPEKQARIYYANHSSHLDGMVIWASLPGHLRPQVRPVAAADYWLSSKLRRYIARRVFNAVLIKRRPAEKQSEQPNNALELMNDPLKKGQSLIIFPEGTRGNGEEISAFKSGIWHLAKMNPDVELVPVYLENLNRVLPKGSRLVVPILCSATFGEPVESIREGEEKAEFLLRARAALETLAP